MLKCFLGKNFQNRALAVWFKSFLLREGQCAVLKKYYFVSSISLKAPSVAAFVCSGLSGSIWKAKTKHQGCCSKRSPKSFRFPGTVSLGSDYTGCIWKNRISCYSWSVRNLCRSPSEVWQKLLVRGIMVPFPHLPWCSDRKRKILILLMLLWVCAYPLLSSVLEEQSFSRTHCRK